MPGKRTEARPQAPHEQSPRGPFADPPHEKTAWDERPVAEYSEQNAVRSPQPSRTAAPRTHCPERQDPQGHPDGHLAEPPEENDLDVKGRTARGNAGHRPRRR